MQIPIINQSGLEICYLLKNISSKICFNLLTRLLKIQTGTNYAGISMVIFFKKIFSKPKRPLVTLWTMDKGYWDSTVMRNPSRPLTFRISHPTTYPRGTTCFMAVISLTWSQEQIFHRTGTDSTIFILSKPSWKKFSILALACF